MPKIYLPNIYLPLLALALCWPNALLAQVTDHVKQSQGFFKSHCVDCHQGPDPSGGLDLKQLDGDLSNAETLRRWVLVHDRVALGEMPPEEAEPPTTADRNTFVASLATTLHAADAKHRQVVLRRLNRQEYQNTVRDLFNTDVQVTGLPADASTDGFDTVGDGLAVSAEAMQAYLEVADQVLDGVFGSPTKPKFIRHETNLLKQVDWKGRPQLDSQIGKMFRRTDDGLVIFQSNYCPTNLVNFARLRAPAGTYRGKIRVRAIQSDKPVTLRIYAGDTIVNRRERHLVGYYDVPPDQWTTIEFTDRLVEAGGTFLPKCYGTRDTRKNADTYPEPGLEIGDITIEGPIEAWPPPSRQRLLGDVDVTKATVDDATRIIGRLLPRAFRRPVSPDEAAPYIALFRDALEHQERPFEEALRISLKAVLCSPEFLFLDEPAKQKTITQHALASRLSYFLWSSMPDETLRTLADKGRLHDADVLREQVERMLKSPKAAAFASNFTGQWLDLRDIDFTEPDPNLYPEYDELLRLSMLKETELFFDDVLERNRPITDFVDADYTYLNGRLASHYGIDGVEGQAFRRVKLPADHVRGGVLTHASVLKVTANGTYTSPVLRGVWMLENVLGTPTSPPPDNVGSVEPDIRGATTIREQLALHRDIESCAACHQRIDPPGFALECFDPIGGFRQRYRTMADDAPRPKISQAPFTYAWVRYRIGKEVDTRSQFPNGQSLETIQDFKSYLSAQPDQLTRNLTRQLLTYSLGRTVGFSDRAAVQSIVDQVRQEDFGFRSLIHAVVQSPLFVKP